MNKTSNWTFVVFDLTTEEFARRVRLLRELRKEGAAMHSQSVYCAPYTESSFRNLENVAENNALILKAHFRHRKNFVIKCSIIFLSVYFLL